MNTNYQRHFEVVANETLYTFEEKCNKVNYKSDKYILFLNSSNNGDELLGMLPHNSIKEILSIRNSDNKWITHFIGKIRRF